MSNLPIYYSIRDFKNGYRGYWLNEQPDSEAWKLGFFWDGRGPEKATQYPNKVSAEEAAQHFVNRGAISPGGFFLEVHAAWVAEIVRHLHSLGFCTIADNWEHTWPHGQIVSGRLLINHETNESCFVFKTGFLRVVGCFVKILHRPDVEQLEFSPFRNS